MILNVFIWKNFGRFHTAISKLDKTGFDAIITRTDTNNPSDGWSQSPTLHFTVAKENESDHKKGYFIYSDQGSSNSSTKYAGF